MKTYRPNDLSTGFRYNSSQTRCYMLPDGNTSIHGEYYRYPSGQPPSKNIFPSSKTSNRKTKSRRNSSQAITPIMTDSIDQQSDNSVRSENFYIKRVVW